MTKPLPRKALLQKINSVSKFIIIDDQGEIYFDNLETKVSDPHIAKQVLQNLKLEKDFVLTTHIDGEPYIVEAFDFPIIAQTLHVTDQQILIHTDYDLYFEADPQQWSVDQDDQFCGVSRTGTPFRLSKKAQTQLFSLCKRYDDDSFTVGKNKILTPPYYGRLPAINTSQFWSEIYQQQEPAWDLNEPAEAFKDMLPRLKLPKSRILVLGCGYGHDAALFAQAGHVVTAVDFSADALKVARSKYSHLTSLTFEQMDIFDAPHDWNFSFDLIIEHTLFCAIDPMKRNNLVTLWKRLLHEEGQLMGVFFSMFKRFDPPYGATEAELRALLIPHFQFLFWGRLRNSVPRRLGKELFILGKKR